jgi:hypothetical protein
VRHKWCLAGRNPSLSLVDGDGDDTFGVSFPRWGVIAKHHVLTARGSPGESSICLWMCDVGVIGVVLSLEVSHLETPLGCGSGGAGWLVVSPVCSGRGGEQGPCWWGGAEDPWVLVVLGWRAWCSGDPSVDVALGILLLWFQWIINLKK